MSDDTQAIIAIASDWELHWLHTRGMELPWQLRVRAERERLRQMAGLSAELADLRRGDLRDYEIEHNERMGTGPERSELQSPGEPNAFLASDPKHVPVVLPTAGTITEALDHSPAETSASGLR